MFRLTIDMIFDLLTHSQPFQITAKLKIKVQNFIIEPSTVGKFVMQPKLFQYVKNYLIAISQKPVNQKKENSPIRG